MPKEAVDECTNQTHSCVARAKCINTPALYYCQCPKGFEGSGLDLSIRLGVANSGGCALSKRSIIIIAVTIPLGLALIAGTVTLAIMTHRNKS